MTRPTRVLTPEAYDTACDLAGSALLCRVPAAASLLEVTEDKVWRSFSAGVYIAADYQNVIRYVGSTVRDSSAHIGDRVKAHVLAGRATSWTRLMLVPLLVEIEEPLARRIEGRIGLVLRPADSRRLPAVPRNRTPRQG